MKIKGHFDWREIVQDVLINEFFYLQDVFRFNLIFLSTLIFWFDISLSISKDVCDFLILSSY